MKASQLKNLLKEAVREVFNEEMKEILLEAVRSHKTPIYEDFRPSTITPSYNSGTPLPPQPISTSNGNFREELRRGYADLLKEQYGGSEPFPAVENSGLKVQRYINTADPNSQLPEGEVSIDQIMNFTKPQE